MKYTIILTLLLSGCVNTYSKQEVDKYLTDINQEFMRHQAYIAQLNNEVFKANIEKGKKSGCKKIILTTGECTA